jgi:hypothetical protein
MILGGGGCAGWLIINFCGCCGGIFIMRGGSGGGPVCKET